MKIKRFFSQDMRNAIRMVREELGPDAVILSNKPVNGGVELIAAIDYDQSLFDSKVQDVISEDASQKSQSATRTKEKPVETPENDILALQVVTDAVTEIKKEASFEDPVQSKPLLTSKIDYFQSPLLSQDGEMQFYNLDDTMSDTGRVSESLFDTKSNQNNSVWSQEPTLVSMRNEIVTLRSLLEKQLTGLAWGETERQNPIRAKLIRQLLELDLSPAVSKKIANEIEEDSDYKFAWQSALTYLTDNLPIVHEDIVVSGGVVALVGPTGVGKTTTVAKLASRYALRYGRKNVGLITIDNYRVGAHEQLKTYARIFDIPLRVATSKESLIDCINALSDRHFVIIDTAGMNHRDARLDNQFQLLSGCSDTLTTLLVMSSTTHRTTLDECIRGFKPAGLDGCILTKIDETTNLGGSISVLLKHNLPVAYYCDGQKMPEALHIATAYSLVNRSILIARKTNQPLAKESIELAFSQEHTHVYI